MFGEVSENLRLYNKIYDGASAGLNPGFWWLAGIIFLDKQMKMSTATNYQVDQLNIIEVELRRVSWRRSEHDDFIPYFPH